MLMSRRAMFWRMVISSILRRRSRVLIAILAVAIVVVSAEVFPTKLRNSGIGFSYNIAAAVFGGLAPLAATALIAATGDRLSITYLMIGSVLVTLLTSVFLLKGYYVKGKRVSD